MDINKAQNTCSIYKRNLLRGTINIEELQVCAHDMALHSKLGDSQNVQFKGRAKYVAIAVGPLLRAWGTSARRIRAACGICVARMRYVHNGRPSAPIDSARLYLCSPGAMPSGTFELVFGFGPQILTC